MESAVYFVKSGNRSKIGCSTQLEKRLSDLKYLNPSYRAAGTRPIELLGTLPGGLVEEAIVHAMFEDRRIRHPRNGALTEWFEDCQEIRDYIADNCRPEVAQ